MSRKTKNSKLKLFSPLTIIIAFIGLIAALILINSISFLQSRATAPSGRFYFMPATTTLSSKSTVDTPLTLRIYANTGKVAFINAEIAFDPQIIQLSRDPIYDPQFGTIISKPDLTTANSTGKAEFVIAVSPAQINLIPSADFAVATVYIKTITNLANVSSTMGIEKYQVVDYDTQLPFTMTSDQALLTINSATATPTATAKPTVSPTPTLKPSATPIPTTNPVTGGDGLTGQYFNNADFTNLAITKIDSQINFNWFYGAPVSTMDTNSFSVRWTGRLLATTSGIYQFYTQSDDGVRLWVNNTLLIDDWKSHSKAAQTGTISLQQGNFYNIKVEYFENKGRANVSLLYSAPNISKSVIPTSALYSK